MTRAIFEAVDPYHRTSDRSQLQNLLADIRGVRDWDVDRDDQVIVDYNHEETSSNVIEEALAGVGYKVKHVQDQARLGKADAPNLGINGESGGNQYGNQIDQVQNARQIKHQDPQETAE